jgi:amyloid beta precursor protein binding protein 1
VIVDNKTIDENDLKDNFFINKTDLGKNRAEISLHNLLELNPDVKGAFFIETCEQFIENSLVQLQTFDIVISSNKQDKFNNTLFNYAEKFCQRVVILKNFGLINYMRVYENFHANMQLKLLDNPINDVRIADPWPELKDFCMSFNLNEMDDMKHKHTPYVILLVQALEHFKLKNGKHPSNSAEKNEFKQLLNSMRSSTPLLDEQNFDEAVNFYYYANKDKLNLLTPDLVSIFEILNNNSIEDLIRKSNVIMSNFFIICKALQIFHSKFNSLPVVGSISDMTSDTETYINLKKM